MSIFSATSTTDEVIAGISLAGKTAVVTGASAGLGVETSRTLAQAGARVLMLGRDAAKLAAAVATVREAVPGAELDSELLDLADLDSIRVGAGKILERYNSIQLLINNAGIMACPLMRTAQGFEMQFGTNHLGHFLLTGLLAPALLAGAPGRVINLSSAGHKMGGINFDDLNYERSDYDPWAAYGQSKTANALFSVALDSRLQSHGVRAFAVHPGAIYTELGRHLDEETLKAMTDRSPGAAAMEFKSVPQGAATSVWAASSAELEGQGGWYLEDCNRATDSATDGIGGVESYALDTADAERLWQLSEQLVGQQFEF